MREIWYYQQGVLLTDNFKERVTNLMVENLPVLRETLKLSQADLAEMLEISRQQVTAIEKNVKCHGVFF